MGGPGGRSGGSFSAQASSGTPVVRFGVCGGDMPNGDRRPYRCGGTPPSPAHSSDEEEVQKQKATYWLRAARGWRRWRRMVKAARGQKRVLAACLLKDGLRIGSQLVKLVLCFLGLGPVANTQVDWGAGGVWAAGRDRTWDSSGEAAQLQYVLQDDAFRHGGRRWRNFCGDLSLATAAWMPFPLTTSGGRRC